MKNTLYREIADKIAAYIKEQKFEPGAQLPTYREFSKLFGVSTHTVGSALERLHYKGLVDIRPQSGIFVMEEAWNTLHPNTFNWNNYLKRTKEMSLTVLKRFSESRERYVPSINRYILSNLGASPNYGWHPIWKKATENAIQKLSPETLNFLSNEELLEIAGALAEYMKEYGLDVPAGDILLTKGTNHSLLYIALTFFSPGAICYYVSPSMVDVAVFCDITGMRPIPLPVDEEGFDLDYFARKIKKGVQSFLIVSPELGMSGMSISIKRRREIYQFCYLNGIPIIEMDEYRDYHIDSKPPIKAFDKHGIVFYTGSFSNTINNSIDAGWVVAAPELTERLRYVLLSMWTGCEVLPHRTVYELLKSGDYALYIKKLRLIVQEKKKLLLSLLEEYLSDLAFWDKKAELFLWVRFRDHIDVHKIVANKEGLTLGDDSQYHFAPKNSILISLTWISEDNLREGIKLLAKIARNSLRI